MVAQAVRSNAFRGIRALDPVRDIYGVARLLEEAFRPEHRFPLGDFPMLREIGIWLWTLSYAPAFPPNLTGFVWIEDNRIVGNVTITQDERRHDLFMISNVAVKPEYRQQGIARQLMRASLDDLRARQSKTVILNVRPNNPSATHLYNTLGFRELEMRGEWSLPHPTPPAPPLPSPERSSGEGRGGWGERGEVRPLRSSDTQAVTELLRAVVPANVEPFRTFQNEFALPFDELMVEWLGDLFIGQSTQRWALERNANIAAVMRVRAQSLWSPHRLAIQVHPRFRGQVEGELVALALSHLATFPTREIRATATDSHPELIAALEQNGFVFANGLRLMSYAFT
ncbi:MAG: GNAT family N-acetyltransferase [Chloroflexi bacterium]|nr:GNAT family N-acetyltransferase [Chloroflexota bacterium]